MPIDTSIYQNIQQPKIESPANALAQVLQLQQARQESQLGQMKMDEYSQGRQREQGLRGLLAGFQPGMSADDQHGALLRGGYQKEAQSLSESAAKTNKDKREADKAAISNAHDKLSLITNAIGASRDAGSYARQLQILQSQGVDVSGIPVQYDPAYVADAGRQAMTEIDRLEQTWKQKGYDLEVSKANETKRSNFASEGNARRGQDSAAATAAAGRAQSARQFGATQAAGKTPAGYRANPDGSMSFIPGGPADPSAGGGKAPTEFQGKSAAFGSRAEQADKIISSLSGKYSPAAINSKQSVEGVWGIGGALGAATNAMALSSDDQRAEQAQRDFINAVLRQESGAAIGESEFSNAKKQYFPQPGDGNAVIAQKKANRELAVRGLQSNAGKAVFSSSSPAAPKNTGKSGDIHSQADEILRGIK